MAQEKKDNQPARRAEDKDGVRAIRISAENMNQLMGLAVGTFVTMVIQSSSATTVMLVSFVQAGLMSFIQSLGVILGADIGTCVTAQLIAFKLTDYALLMVAIGFGFKSTSKKENIRNIGEVIFGFGILFFGMKLPNTKASDFSYTRHGVSHKDS